MKRNDDIYLKHVLEHVNKIEKALENLSKKEFESDSDAQDSTIRRIEVIGEAVKNISEKLKKTYPKVEWKNIAGTRDVLICQEYASGLTD
ncbi:MAG: DUF86 domain-containing protein [Nanoarchaeota archaeon]|nr:DUF86 domain-containing protein [Nanoarchaeota archaeon]